MPEVMLGQPRLHRLRKVSDTPCWAARYTFADICGHSPALHKALRQVEGNRNEAARLVGLSRASFYRKLTCYGILPSS